MTRDEADVVLRAMSINLGSMADTLGDMIEVYNKEISIADLGMVEADLLTARCHFAKFFHNCQVTKDSKAYWAAQLKREEAEDECG